MATCNCKLANQTKDQVFIQGNLLSQFQGFFPSASTCHMEYAEASFALTLANAKIKFCPDLYQGTTIVDRLIDYKSAQGHKPGGSKGDTKKGLKSVDGWLWLNQWIPYDVKSFDVTTQGIPVEEYINCVRAHGNVMIFIYNKNNFVKKQTQSAILPDFITCLSEISSLKPVTKQNSYGKNVLMMDYVFNNSRMVEGVFNKSTNNNYDLMPEVSSKFSGTNLPLVDVIHQFLQNCPWP